MRDDKNAKAVLIATGSEVAIALETAELLKQQGIAVRIVSMPSTTVFDQQSKVYKDSVLPANLPRIAIEAGVTDYWWKYGCVAVHGVDTFGESAPASVLYKHFGLTAESVAKTVRQCI
jgi:transketolase